MATINRKKKAYYQGLFAEYWAAAYLSLKGYKILQFRYKTKTGEIDLVAKKRNTFIFAEVKYRNDMNQGYEAITPQSQKRIRRTAEYYLLTRNNESSILNQDIRCDALLINKFFFIKHIKNAF